MTTRKMAGRDVGAQVGRINRKVKGWSNYFRLGTVSKAFRNVNSHVRHRVRQIGRTYNHRVTSRLYFNFIRMVLT